MTFKFNNGDKVKCIVTGFAGIITGRGDYLNGCVSYCIKPAGLDKDGKMRDGAWIDEGQLELVEANALRRPEPQRAVGGPRADAAPEMSPR